MPRLKKANLNSGDIVLIVSNPTVPSLMIIPCQLMKGKELFLDQNVLFLTLLTFSKLTNTKCILIDKLAQKLALTLHKLMVAHLTVQN